MICHFSHSCERMNCGSEVHGKDEILSRGIPVHWRSCVRNTLFCVSGFKRTTPHFLVWAEYVVNFQNNTAVFLAVWFVMAKAAVKKKKKSPTTTKTMLSSCSCLHSAWLLVVYFAENFNNGETALFSGAGGKKYFPNMICFYLFSHKLCEERI